MGDTGRTLATAVLQLMLGIDVAGRRHPRLVLTEAALVHRPSFSITTHIRMMSETLTEADVSATLPKVRLSRPDKATRNFSLWSLRRSRHRSARQIEAANWNQETWRISQLRILACCAPFPGTQHRLPKARLASREKRCASLASNHSGVHGEGAAAAPLAIFENRVPMKLRRVSLKSL